MGTLRGNQRKQVRGYDCHARLGNDFYEFDEKNYCLIGRRHHQKFSLGDPIKIKVARANLAKEQLDFVLAET